MRNSSSSFASAVAIALSLQFGAASDARAATNSQETSIESPESQGHITLAELKFIGSLPELKDFDPSANEDITKDVLRLAERKWREAYYGLFIRVQKPSGFDYALDAHKDPVLQPWATPEYVQTLADLGVSLAGARELADVKHAEELCAEAPQHHGRSDIVLGSAYLLNRLDQQTAKLAAQYLGLVTD